MTSLKNNGPSNTTTTATLDSNARAAALASWPRHLRTPTELVEALRTKTRLGISRSPLCSKLVLQFIGSWAYILAHVLNKSKIYNIEIFNQELRRLERQHETHAKLLSTQTGGTQSDQTSPDVGHQQKPHAAPLITLSNHISCIDDPILWGILLPFNYYFTRTETVRWSAAATDICFSKPWHSTFFSLGKTFPIMRGVGLDQPAMDFAAALLRHDQWLHLFPEGRVMRNDKQEVISNIERGYIFKWGISKLILDFFRRGTGMKPNSEIRILPFYHLGMDKVLPIGRPYLPRFNKRITVYMRPSVIEMNSRLLTEILSKRTLSARVAKSRSNDEIVRIKLTNYLEEQLEKLIEPATKLHSSV